jgi:hypothetical protein
MIGPGETDSGIYGLILVRQAFGTLGIFLSDSGNTQKIRMRARQSLSDQ